MVEKVSAPIIRTFLYIPDLMYCTPVEVANNAPEQTAEISNATAFFAFSFS